MNFTNIKALTFDCYGTLIDWEMGILNTLRSLLPENGHSFGDNRLLEAFGEIEADEERTHPTMLYPDILKRVYNRLMQRLNLPSNVGHADRFGNAVGDWPTFPDSPSALQYLQRHFKLVILSNVDRASFARAEEKLGLKFYAVYTAQDIGSYKPAPKNFHFMLDKLAAQGITANEIIHVAQSKHHDILPATELGLRTVWVNRRHDKPGWGATLEPAREVQAQHEVDSMAELTRLHHESLMRAENGGQA